MSELVREISTPSDNDGYALLQCHFCGEYFKITPADYKDDSVLNIHCPSCGLSSENYTTEDVLELAKAMGRNMARDMVYNEMKKLGKQFSKGAISFKVGRKPMSESENPIMVGIDNLMITEFSCCKRTAKIEPILKISGCCCPFCGVKNFELE